MAGTASQWFARFQRAPATAPLRLFTFPFAGGGSSIYRQWDTQLQGIDVFAATLPGRERRLLEPPMGDLTLLLRHMLPAVLELADRPFALFGHSMGALIAYELACALEAQGVQPQHLIVSAYRSPEMPKRNRILHDLADADFLAELRRYGGSPDEVLHNPEIVHMLLPMLRADFRLHETYQYTHTTPLNCPISALAGRRDRHVTVAEIQGWREKTKNKFDLQIVEGEHFFVVNHLEDVLRLVQGYLEPWDMPRAGRLVHDTSGAET